MSSHRQRAYHARLTVTGDGAIEGVRARLVERQRLLHGLTRLAGDVDPEVVDGEVVTDVLDVKYKGLAISRLHGDLVGRERERLGSHVDGRTVGVRRRSGGGTFP